MTLLEHLDELRSRLFKSAILFVLVFFACWGVSGPILRFLMEPIKTHLPGGMVFIHLTEPFLIYMKASGLAALFLVTPFLLYQFWAFVAPGLYRNERRVMIPFLLFGTFFFVLGGAFGYKVAVPTAASWLIGLGSDFEASLTIRSAFQFLSRVILGMGVVFEMPVLIFFLSWIGVVTPAFLMRHFRHAVLIIAILAAVITPTGDMLTMSVFAGPMILLYLLGVGVSWIAQRRTARSKLAESGQE
jgi:sec-independent protein translocase protein TatC